MVILLVTAKESRLIPPHLVSLISLNCVIKNLQTAALSEPGFKGSLKEEGAVCSRIVCLEQIANGTALKAVAVHHKNKEIIQCLSILV